MTARESDVVKSVGRVFKVLELFDVTRRPMTCADIGRELALAPSSAITLLKSMVKMGYLSFHPLEFTYIPTMRLSLISDWVRNLVECDRDIFRIMDELASYSEETVSLWCENDGQMEILRALPGRHHKSEARAGERMPMFGCVIGQTALARRSDREIAQLARKLGRRPGSLKQRIDINAEMHRIGNYRATGYGIDHHPKTTKLLLLAWAVPSRLHDFPFVLSVGGLSERIGCAQQELVGRLRSVIPQRSSLRSDIPTLS